MGRAGLLGCRLGCLRRQNVPLLPRYPTRHIHHPGTIASGLIATNGERCLVTVMKRNVASFGRAQTRWIVSVANATLGMGTTTCSRPRPRAHEFHRRLVHGAIIQPWCRVEGVDRLRDEQHADCDKRDIFQTHRCFLRPGALRALIWPPVSCRG